MQFMLQPYHILVAALIGWANERQQQIIEFQNDQIKALLKKLGKKRVLLTDDQRRVLAVKGHGHRWWEIDTNYWFILLLKKLGLAWNVADRIDHLDATSAKPQHPELLETTSGT